jgi:hypothetical protein
MATQRKTTPKDISNTATPSSAVEQQKTTPLYAYKSLQNRLGIAATLLIPSGVVGAFVLLCLSNNEYALKGMITVTPTLRNALIAHGVYFISLVPMFELMLDVWPITLNGTLPRNPDNGYWMMTCLSGELFFVSAVCYGLMALQTEVPRWTLILPIAQCAYNMKVRMFTDNS